MLELIYTGAAVDEAHQTATGNESSIQRDLVFVMLGYFRFQSYFTNPPDRRASLQVWERSARVARNLFTLLK